MSIVDTYKDQFAIFSYDEDVTRSEKVSSYLEKNGFQLTAFNSRGLFLETLEKKLPHIIILYYQPLNLKFRETLSQIRKVSSEVEIVLFGSNDFWPGIYSLMQAGLVNDFWTWPLAGQEQLQLRLSRVIEKTIYKFIAEQRSEETEAIVQRLESLEAPHQSEQNPGEGDTTDVSRLFSQEHKTEATLIEELVKQLKTSFPASEFIYFKNYRAKDQLLVTRTSFASENYFRGQSIPFNQERLLLDRGETLNKLRDLIEETFSCEEFHMQPVEFAGEFFGMIMAVNFTDNQFLQKTARYLSVSLRNYHLESSGKATVEERGDFELSVKQTHFPLALSTEVSRARRLKMPVSLIYAHVEFVGDNDRDFEKAYELMKNNLRNYDLISEVGDNQIGIILPHCSFENAAIKAETLRRQIVARGLKSQNTPLRLCFGVSEYPRLSVDSDSLMEDAKKACSQVMVSGKNKVCLYSAPDNFDPEFQPASL